MLHGQTPLSLHTATQHLASVQSS